jgi:ABC-type Zn uptake system ZnuABC Zn-binding protein ZnuA
VAVVTLVPPGASPHLFEPLPGDVARLARARGFLRLGEGIDDWAERLLAAAPRSLETLALLEAAGPAIARHGAALPDGGAAGAVLADPHVWLDPLLVRDALLPALEGWLKALDPAGRTDFERRAGVLRASLTALDREIRGILAGARGRSYVAFHNAWRHFARRYGLEEVAVVEEFAGEEPTPRELARLVRAAERAGVAAILVEPQLPARVAQTLAREFGGATVLVDPLGDPRDPERDSYAELLRFDARAFARALGGGPP